MAIAGVVDTAFPMIAKDTPNEAIEEILARERRTLFVAMTRAMRALLAIVPTKNPSILLKDFNATLWNLGAKVDETH